jgi:hemoglobin
MTHDFKRLDSLYQELGAEKILELVTKFYFFMDTRKECLDIRKMHPQDLSGSIDKLNTFLVQRFGGPWLYNNKYGPPMMRARHMPFKIGINERNQWLFAMNQALNDLAWDEKLADLLFVFFADFAEKIRNQE